MSDNKTKKIIYIVLDLSYAFILLGELFQIEKEYIGASTFSTCVYCTQAYFHGNMLRSLAAERTFQRTYVSQTINGNILK